MWLTITTTHEPATDLGYLLFKHPGRVQQFELPFARAHVFYPEANINRCTVAMLMEVDPVGLIRNRRGPSGEGFSLEQYVNDRPYVASSFMSVAIAQVFGSALSGISRDRSELARTAIPLGATIAVVRGPESLLRGLFEPLGYGVCVTAHPLDEAFPEWGPGIYFTLQIDGHQTVKDLLSHLYVLIPVLDNDKHYWIGTDEADKLLRHGETWLRAHPLRETIVNRYLRRLTHLTRPVMAQLLSGEEPDPDAALETRESEEQAVEQPIRLNEQRMGAVMEVLLSSGAKRVLDLGCGSGNLLRRLLDEKQFDQIVGMDVSHRALEMAEDRLRLDRLPERKRQKIQLIHGSLTYRDKRLAGFDAAAAIEVIEHLDPHRLSTFERVLFEFARPKLVIITTPNVEYNVKFPSLPSGKFRHRDHRFEWTRSEFQAWSNTIKEQFGYSAEIRGIGEVDELLGAPTQMGIFALRA